MKHAYQMSAYKMQEMIITGASKKNPEYQHIISPQAAQAYNAKLANCRLL